MWTPAPDAEWRTSKRSGGQGQCVEVALANEGAAVRDSKSRKEMLTFGSVAWTAFVDHNTKP